MVEGRKSRECKTWIVLAIASIFGFCVGAFVQPVWTDNVESAQIIAGVVTYPVHTPMEAYHTGVYSLLIQSAALLLRMGLSEWTVSLLSSGFQAALSCSALALLTLLFSRNATVSLAVPVIFLRLAQAQPKIPQYIEAFHGHLYPNLFPCSSSIYGVTGLFWMIFVLCLLGLGKYRTGGFCLGLLPGIHVGMAIPCYFGAACASLLMIRSIRPAFKPVAVYLSAGLAIVALTALWQFAAFPAIPTTASPDEIKTTAEIFLRVWDDHCRLLMAGEWPSFFESEYYTLLLGIALLTLLRKHIHAGARFTLIAILAITLAAIVYTIILNLQPDLFHWRIRSLMITRWLNLSSFAFPAISFGLLGYTALVRRNLPALILLMGMFTAILAAGWTPAITAAAAGAYGPDIPFYLPAFLRALIFPVVLVVGTIVMTASRQRGGRTWPKRSRLEAALLLTGLFVYSLCWHHLRQIQPDRVAGKDQHSEFFEFVGRRNGILLPASNSFYDIGRVQLRTRRPVLLDMTQLNFLLKMPEQGPVIFDIMEFAFSMDFDPTACEYERSPLLRFTTEHWQKVREKFGVTDILVRKDFSILHLPKVADNGFFALYTIPASPQEDRGQK